jgi:hypothetical protein
VRRLLVAAGGGGDAIAAAVLASVQPGEAVAVATLAWDRLIVDPLPGPRRAADFTGLASRHGYHLVTPSSRPIPPAGSTLPRVAGQLPLLLMLLDPSHGAVGIRQQLAAAAADLRADTIQLVDVGGDILGRPDDPGLRSPLADALMAASATGLPATVCIAGPGLDGELAEALVLERIGETSQPLTLKADGWPPYLPILEWHPSEATALLAAASLGLRGRVEIRDAGLPVQLTDHSATAYELPLATIADANPLAAALADSTTFADVEQIAQRLLGWTELDEERAKAARVAQARPIPADIGTALPAWEAEARARGVDYVTFRRLAEVLGWVDVAALRAALVKRYPAKSMPPIWKMSW